MTTAREIYEGSDGEATRAYYAELEKAGPLGLVAVALFRAQKASGRAKVYRGGIRGQGSFRRMAYDKKQWSLGELTKILAEHGAALGIGYGWKEDETADYVGAPCSWVLYVDLPRHGQVSFHSPGRGSGPDYPRDWDRQRQSAERIIAFCDWVMARPDERQLALDISAEPELA